MVRGVMVVEGRPRSAEVEDEFNAWYTDVHIPELLAVPGFLGARRYRLHDPSASAADAGRYLTVYELDADDLLGPIKEARSRRTGTEDPVRDRVLELDPPAKVSFYELVEDVRA